MKKVQRSPWDNLHVVVSTHILEIWSYLDHFRWDNLIRTNYFIMISVSKDHQNEPLVFLTVLIRGGLACIPILRF